MMIRLSAFVGWAVGVEHVGVEGFCAGVLLC